MTDYRGLPKSAVVESLQGAERFVRQLNLGPAITQKLDEWAAKTPFTKIQAATDRNAVAQAMRETGSSNVFLRLNEVLRYHALLDTDGLGKKVYVDLCKWGGLSGSVNTSYGPVDEEADIHLITEYAKMVDGQQQVAPMAYGTRLYNALNEVGNRQPDVVKDLEQHVQSLADKARAGDEQGIADNVLQSHLRLRNNLKQVMFYVSGLSQDVQMLNAPQVFGRYGIAVDPAQYATNDQAEEAKYDLAEQAHDILGSFYDTDEVQKAMIGSITDDGKKSGLVFVSTRRAAEALADHFNQQQQVIDRAGRPVMPSANKGHPLTPPAPQP